MAEETVGSAVQKILDESFKKEIYGTIVKFAEYMKNHPDEENVTKLAKEFLGLPYKQVVKAPAAAKVVPVPSTASSQSSTGTVCEYIFIRGVNKGGECGKK